MVHADLAPAVRASTSRPRGRSRSTSRYRGRAFSGQLGHGGRAALGIEMLPISYRRHSFPPTVIQHAVWLYLRFTLSYRDVEELLAQRGLDLSYTSVRSWVPKFGPMIARRLWLCRRRPSDRWQLDEMVVRIAGKRIYLWRAVDHEGEIFDELLQDRRDHRAPVAQAAAETRFRAQEGDHRRAARVRNRMRRLRLGCHHEQITGRGSSLPEHACRRPQCLQPPKSSCFPVDASDLPIGSRGALADCCSMIDSSGYTRPPSGRAK
jgi:DDE domain